MKRNKLRFFAIDLFAGCGGLSEGFKRAGFNIVTQIEMDKWACETLKTRHLFYKLKEKKHREIYNKYLRDECSRNDILKRNPDIEKSINNSVVKATFGQDKFIDVINKIEKNKDYHGINHIHVLLGGPPCQPYSLVGRARDPHRMEKDSRHFLYKYYLRILEYLQPDFFVYENVPGLFTARAQGKEIFVKILKDFSSLIPPYEITPPLTKIYRDPCSYILNSADFGIPQSRKRLFLIGYRKSLESNPPVIKELFTVLQKKARNNRDREGFLTVDDAIGDLPAIKPGEGKDEWFGFYDKRKKLKSYQIKMRKDSVGILNHKARKHMKSDLERYKFFIEYHKSGNGAATLKTLKQKSPSLLPQHKNLTSFIDRFKVQWWNQPSSTITAHISKDGHYYIHPDIAQCRSFTVREAARCQSFPDNYKFEGPRTAQFKQVGNAVPPLLAHEIARVILKELKKLYEH